MKETVQITSDPRYTGFMTTEKVTFALFANRTRASGCLPEVAKTLTVLAGEHWFSQSKRTMSQWARLTEKKKQELCNSSST